MGIVITPSIYPWICSLTDDNIAKMLLVCGRTTTLSYNETQLFCTSQNHRTVFAYILIMPLQVLRSVNIYLKIKENKVRNKKRKQIRYDFLCQHKRT